MRVLCVCVAHQHGPRPVYKRVRTLPAETLSETKPAHRQSHTAHPYTHTLTITQAILPRGALTCIQVRRCLHTEERLRNGRTANRCNTGRNLGVASPHPPPSTHTHTTSWQSLPLPSVVSRSRRTVTSRTRPQRRLTKASPPRSQLCPAKLLPEPLTTHRARLHDYYRMIE